MSLIARTVRCVYLVLIARVDYHYVCLGNERLEQHFLSSN